MAEKFNISARLKSFVYAFNGINLYFKTQHNVWIHLSIGFLVLVFGIFFNISSIEWALVLLAMGLVLSAEGFNSAIELLCDEISPEHNKRIGQVKDIAAGSVLVTAIFAALVGLIVFIPKFFSLF